MEGADKEKLIQRKSADRYNEPLANAIRIFSLISKCVAAMTHKANQKSAKESTYICPRRGCPSRVNNKKGYQHVRAGREDADHDECFRSRLI